MCAFANSLTTHIIQFGCQYASDGLGGVDPKPWCRTPVVGRVDHRTGQEIVHAVLQNGEKKRTRRISANWYLHEHQLI